MVLPSDGVVPQLDEFDFDPLRTDWMSGTGFDGGEEDEQLLASFVFPETEEFLVPGNLTGMENKPGYEDNVPLVPTMDTSTIVDGTSEYALQMALSHKSQRALRQAKRKASEQLAQEAAKKRDSEKSAVTAAPTTPEHGNDTKSGTKGTVTSTKGKNGDDKDSKRAKRLLRNRVSAQQARERKKCYVSNLEKKTKELEEKMLSMEVQISKLQQENGELRSKLESHGLAL